jgi:UDP-N-acetylglucosamine 2-epimerase (non-hydrolysing)
MKVMTVLGTRPEIIRLSRIIPVLDEACDHVLVHTGQNFHAGLSDVFFSELGIRDPDHYLGVKGETFGQQVAMLLERVEQLFIDEHPDRLLILGDTNSGLSSILARRFGIPTFHMEAGNRCYDDRVPEEVNRRIIDHCSSVLMPYTHRSRENLVREGIERSRIFVTGNPIKQVIDHFSDRIDRSDILERMELEGEGFFLVTMHRAETVDNERSLSDLVTALNRLYQTYSLRIVCSLHPRTRSKIERFGVDVDRAGLLFVDPIGFFDFVRLERQAFCILTDSGTVQEEACIFGRASVTVREVTERPETLEHGSNVLAGTDPDRIHEAVALVTSRGTAWTPPPEYLIPNVAEAVSRVVLGFRPPDAAEWLWRSS